MHYHCSSFFIRFVAASLLIASSFGLQACLTLGTRAVAEADKDTTGSFDGAWVVIGNKTASTQHVGEWRMSCTRHEGRRHGPLTVENGRASMKLNDSTGSGFVGADGNFRVEVPLDAVAKETGTSDGSINNGAITFILDGSLATNIGRFTFGIAEFGNAGCSSSAVFEKL